MRDWPLTLAFIDVESSWRRDAFLEDRNGGSYGLMQIDLATAKDRGYVGDGPGLLVPHTNLRQGTYILDWLTAQLMKADKYSVANLAAAYNAGLSHVLNGGDDPVYSGKIAAAYAFYQSLNRTANGP